MNDAREHALGHSRTGELLLITGLLFGDVDDVIVRVTDLGYKDEQIQRCKGFFKDAAEGGQRLLQLLVGGAQLSLCLQLRAQAFLPDDDTVQLGIAVGQLFETGNVQRFLPAAQAACQLMLLLLHAADALRQGLFLLLLQLLQLGEVILQHLAPVALETVDGGDHIPAGLFQLLCEHLVGLIGHLRIPVKALLTHQFLELPDMPFLFPCLLFGVGPGLPDGRLLLTGRQLLGGRLLLADRRLLNGLGLLADRRPLNGLGLLADRRPLNGLGPLADRRQRGRLFGRFWLLVSIISQSIIQIDFRLGQIGGSPVCLLLKVLLAVISLAILAGGFLSGSRIAPVDPYPIALSPQFLFSFDEKPCPFPDVRGRAVGVVHGFIPVVILIRQFSSAQVGKLIADSHGVEQTQLRYPDPSVPAVGNVLHIVTVAAVAVITLDRLPQFLIKKAAGVRVPGAAVGSETLIFFMHPYSLAFLFGIPVVHSSVPPSPAGAAVPAV